MKNQIDENKTNEKLKQKIKSFLYAEEEFRNKTKEESEKLVNIIFKFLKSIEKTDETLETVIEDLILREGEIYDILKIETAKKILKDLNFSNLINSPIFKYVSENYQEYTDSLAELLSELVSFKIEENSKLKNKALKKGAKLTNWFLEKINLKEKTKELFESFLIKIVKEFKSEYILFSRKELKEKLKEKNIIVCEKDLNEYYKYIDGLISISIKEVFEEFKKNEKEKSENEKIKKNETNYYDFSINSPSCSNSINEIEKKEEEKNKFGKLISLIKKDSIKNLLKDGEFINTLIDDKELCFSLLKTFSENKELLKNINSLIIINVNNLTVNNTFVNKTIQQPKNYFI